MARQRTVVGANGDGKNALTVARTLRDEGHEVVLVGGGQTAEQLVRAALAEDAAELVVADDDVDLVELESVRRRLGADELQVTARGVTDLTRQDPR
ncbi:hypothetical protein GCM10022234_24990 [Aeromicrobium panaciterrae]|uniref:hypothetical protein n=1 Tax=Aeromicrobium panaciterrae TaxID=363861 RepID=UPI0031D2F143